jgi:hypothetical protein
MPADRDSSVTNLTGLRKDAMQTNPDTALADALTKALLIWIAAVGGSICWVSNIFFSVIGGKFMLMLVGILIPPVGVAHGLYMWCLLLL